MSVTSHAAELPGVVRRLRKHARRPQGVAAEPQDIVGPTGALDEAFRAGDAEAARVLAECMLPLVARIVRRLTAWSEEADDLVQDVLVSALASRSKFRGQAKLETWITRIAINRCRAFRRKQWLRSKLQATWLERRAPGAKSEAAAEERLIGREEAELVRDAVASLPATSREAIVLCYLEGMSVAEAAKTLGVRRGTLEVRLSRARQQLRELLPAGMGEQITGVR